MIYIGFSTRTHKLYVRVLCKKFTHCAPVIGHGKKYLIYQFVHKNKIETINVSKRDLHILNQYGWVFVKYDSHPQLCDLIHNKSLTCVQFTKHVCGIKNWRIQTPDDLYQFVVK